MPDQVIQSSFNSGEWAPSLFSRVDITKYRSGAALLQNFFVDYRGGASTRTGTKYILQTKSNSTVRLIPFQASFSVSYILEFGNQYIRFYSNGAPVLEATTAITGATKANPGVITDVAHGYSTGDWIYILNVGGMTQLNGNYYIVVRIDADHYSLTDLNGVAVNTTSFTAYTSGGTAQRVYTLTTSPYLSTELAQIKFAQNGTTMVLCHPNHQPYQLVLTSATSWAISAITFGATIAAPGGLSTATTLAAGTVNYAYVVTAVDSAGQESDPSAFATLANLQDIRSVAGSNRVSWTAVTGAISYNVYRAQPSYGVAVPAGSDFGFVGNLTGTTFVDSNIAPDFSVGIPVAQNPFFGSGVQNVTITNAGSGFTTVPTITFTGGGGSGAAATATLTTQGSVTISAAGSGYTLGEVVVINGDHSGWVGVVSGINGIGGLTSVTPGINGTVTSGAVVNSGFAIAAAGSFGQIAVDYGLKSIDLSAAGAGYGAAPTVGISGGTAAAATATLGAASAGNPTVPAFFQQRLVLAGPVSSPNTFYMSKTGAYYNYDISIPSQADDAITATLVSGQLNTIKSMVSQTTGLLMLTDKASWLINGGTGGVAVSPSSIVANAQSYIGAGDPPPIVSNFDVLFVQAKGSIVRDNVYNIYSNVFTGTDVSILSSHLFYGYTISEWAWAEEPFKVVYAVRNDGTMLTLTFLKEQEFVGWAHSTTNGLFTSVATVTESVSIGSIDAVYVVAQRIVNGNTVKYIERFAERSFTNGVRSAWCVDAGIQYIGSPATTFTGAQHLAGMTVTGLADGVVIPAFTMPTSGSFTLSTAASTVTVGLAYTCKLQTLPLEIGEPTIQGKVKKINYVDVRVADTLGLSIGPDFSNLVTMKDLVVGNVSSMLVGQPTQVVSDLVSGDARTWLAPTYTVPGQYCIQQSQPLPATILGVIPNITVGDDGGRKG